MIFLLSLFLFCSVTEVRQEAVQQALAAMQSRPKPSLPMPSKRTSVMGRAPDHAQQESGTKQYYNSTIHFSFISCYIL